MRLASTLNMVAVVVKTAPRRKMHWFLYPPSYAIAHPACRVVSPDLRGDDHRRGPPENFLIGNSALIRVFGGQTGEYSVRSRGKGFGE